MFTTQYVNDDRFTNVRPQVTHRERIDHAMRHGRATLGDSIERQIMRRQGYYGKTLPPMDEDAMGLRIWF